MANFTPLWTWEGWWYPAVVLDLFSRWVLGGSIWVTMTEELVADALPLHRRHSTLNGVSPMEFEK